MKTKKYIIEFTWVKKLSDEKAEWKEKVSFTSKTKMEEAFHKLKQKNLFKYRMVFPDGTIKE